MPTVNIGGRRVKVDDSFLSMSPADQQATVDEIEASIGPAPAAEAAPTALPDSLPAPEIPPTGPLLSRKAMRDPRWPDAQGAAVAPPSISDVPFDDEAWLSSHAPPATAFPNPPGSFQTPANAMPYTPPPETPAALGVPSEMGLGAPTVDPNAPAADPLRTGKIALQALGNAAVNVPGIIADVPALAAKGIETGAYKSADILAGLGAEVGNLFGGKFGNFRDVRIERPEAMPDRALPTDWIKDVASTGASKLGYDTVDPNTFGEKLFSNAVQYGAEGLGGGVALSRAAAGRAASLAQPGATATYADPFLRPYFESPGKALFGDTVAGATAGGALTGSQEIPEDVRKMGGGSVGALSDIFSMLVGGVGGGTLASGITGAPNAALSQIQKRSPALDFVDPITGLPAMNQHVDEAARLLQSIVTKSSPQDAAAKIGAEAKSFRDQGLPVPTTGLLTDDIGLAGLDKRQRTIAGPGATELAPDASPEVRQKYSFGERDEAQRKSAADNVQSIRQKDGDPELFQQRAKERADMELQARQRQVDQPAGKARGVQQAREEQANAVAENIGQTPGASSDIFDVYSNTRTLERTRSDALYTKPEWTQSTVDINPTLEAAQDIYGKATGSSPVSPATEPFLKRIEAAKETGTLPGWEVSKMIKDIEAKIKVSLKDGEDFTQLKELKDSLLRSIDQLPDDHAGKIAIGAARENVAQRIAPNFRQNVGGNLDMRLKTNPGQVDPETAGAGFLNRGSSARQLMDIADLRGNAAQVAESARTIIFERMAESGVIKDGVLDPDKLIRWRNRNDNIIGAIPGLRGHVDGMIEDARNGVDLAARYGGQVKQAETKLANTAKEIQQSPVGKIADQTPTEAVATIMQGKNARKNMEELKARMGNNPDANKSLKTAVVDYFIDKVGKLKDTDADYEVRLQSLVKHFNEHRETLVAAGMTADEMQALQRAQKVLEPLSKRNVQATVGSTTAESTEAAMRPLELALKGYYGILKGGGMFRTVKIALKTISGNSDVPVGQILTRVMFDPELAQKLLTRDVKKAGTPAWNADLQKALRRITAARGAVENDEETEPPETAGAR